MAKEVKKVKCKGCKLTYDKKLYKCPYCHRKRFNPTGLIIFLIIFVIALGAAGYFYWDEIKEFIANKQAETVLNENEGKGLVFKNVSVTKSEEKENIYTIKFDIENKTGNSLDEEYTLFNLADKVKADVVNGRFFTLAKNYEIISLKMLKDEIYKAEYNIEIKEDWKTLEIFLRKNNRETKEIEDIKIFTYENNIIEETTTEETTTQISIITE